MLASPSWLAWSEDLRVSGHWTCAQSAFRKENKWTYSIWPWQHHKHYFYKATLLCIAQDAADCYRWNATVCVLFTSMSPAQMAEMIEMSFGMWTLQTTEPCIKWGPSSPPIGRGTFGEGILEHAQACPQFTHSLGKQCGCSLTLR